jgi:hypothetical protein
VSPTGVGRRNRLFGWCLLLAGILGGIALGTFVFDGPLRAPARFADYGALPRRLIRFAHIAAMALGILNVLYGREIDRPSLSRGSRAAGSTLMIAAGAGMPVLLALAAFDLRWRGALLLPATAAFVAIAILVRGLARGEAA